MGRKASPSPTLGWKNQRGSIPEKWGGGLAEAGQRLGSEGDRDTKRPVRDPGERPRKGDSEIGEEPQRHQGEKARPGEGERGDPGIAGGGVGRGGNTGRQ